MSRELRRKKLTGEDIHEIIKNTFIETCEIFTIIMHDKYNWDKTQIEELLLQTKEMNDSILKKYLSLQDIRQTIHDELNIIIR